MVGIEVGVSTAVSTGTGAAAETGTGMAPVSGPRTADSDLSGVSAIVDSGLDDEYMWLVGSCLFVVLAECYWCCYCCLLLTILI